MCKWCDLLSVLGVGIVLQITQMQMALSTTIFLPCYFCSIFEISRDLSMSLFFLTYTSIYTASVRVCFVFHVNFDNRSFTPCTLDFLLVCVYETMAIIRHPQQNYIGTYKPNTDFSSCREISTWLPVRHLASLLLNRLWLANLLYDLPHWHKGLKLVLKWWNCYLNSRIACCSALAVYILLLCILNGKKGME